MRSYQRPQEKILFVQKADVKAVCPVCNSTKVKQYPVVSDGGWWRVTKCQECLHSLERKRRASRYGMMTTIADRL